MVGELCWAFVAFPSPFPPEAPPVLPMPLYCARPLLGLQGRGGRGEANDSPVWASALPLAS